MDISYFFDFLCKTNNQQVKLDRDALQEYQWVFPGQALRMDLDSSTRKSGGRIPFTSTAGRLLDVAVEDSLDCMCDTGEADGPEEDQESEAFLR